MNNFPDLIEIEPTESCNFRCTMCHVSFMPEGHSFSLDLDQLGELDIIAGRHVVIGTGFEPMMHRQFAKLVEKLSQLECKIEITTNGSLLYGSNADALASSNLQIVNLSFDGIKKETYEKIRRNSNYEKVLENILKFKARFGKNRPKFAVNSTMQRLNMDEVPQLVDFWDSHDFDLVRLLFMVVRENSPELVKQSLYPVRTHFYSILDAVALESIAKNRKIGLRSPYYQFSPLRNKYPRNFYRDTVYSDNTAAIRLPTPRQDFQQGFQNGNGFPCRSPWTFAKILPNGKVQLCYQFEVGDLKANSFKDIWLGATAENVRQQLLDDPSACKRCDYYRFCISSDTLDVDDVKNYFSERLVVAAEDVNFESGEITASIPPPPPRLVDTIGIVNIVEYLGKFFVVPHSIGAVDLSITDLSTHDQVTFTETLAAARRAAVSYNDANLVKP